MFLDAEPVGSALRYGDFSPPVFDRLTPHLEAQRWCNVWTALRHDQQELAERIASWTALLIGQHNYLTSLGDARPPDFPTPDEFRATIIEYVQSRHLFGIDLSEVALTRKGIVLR